MSTNPEKQGLSPAERLEFVDELDRLVRHRRIRGAGGHHHAVDIEVRHAHDAIAALRQSLEGGTVTREALERVRSAGNAVQLTRPRAFAELVDLLERDLVG